MPLELKVPPMGESITEVQIGTWLKREGETAAKDEPLVEIESEKATVEVSAPEAGQLTQILKRPGEPARVGEVIGHFLPAVTVTSAESEGSRGEPAAPTAPGSSARPPETLQPSGNQQSAGGKKPAAPEPAAAPETAQGDWSPSEKASSNKAPAGETPRVMPAAARRLAETGLSPGEVPASGPGGRLLKEDVDGVAKSEKSPPPAEKPGSPKQEDSTPTVARQAAKAERVTPIAPQRVDGAIPGTAVRADWPRDEESVPMTPMRRAIAERLVSAQQNMALVTTFNEIDMSGLAQLRQNYRESFQDKYGIKLGLMSFFVKAVVDGLRQIPQLNAEIRNNDIVYRNYYDIGVAVGGGKGLVVPVVRNAERLSFAEIEVAIDHLARRARDNKLKVDELTGGTFTISNGGVYGSLLSTPIINPPQSGVLGLHAIEERPIARDGQVVVRPMMYVALTYDHRLVDGREAVSFLKRVKEVIEEPARMLLEV